jgi:AcrR family transcriptional regulator
MPSRPAGAAARKAPAKRAASKAASAEPIEPEEPIEPADVADWQRRVVGRSLRSATQRSIDRGASLIKAAATLLERSGGEGFTVQEVANEAGQSLRTLYQYFESKDDLLLAVFEEAMRRYAVMIQACIAGLDDPLERLMGAVIAAASMPAHSSRGVDAGLARLRLRLSDAEPSLVARSHEPVTLVFLDLVRAAVAAGELPDLGAEASVYMVTSLNGSFIISQTLGNDYGLGLPDAEGLARFCLQGLGAELPRGWYKSITKRLRAPEVPDDSGWNPSKERR